MKTLDPDLLLRAYSIGVFPMSDGRDAQDLYWVEPKRRAIIPLNGFHLSRTLRKTIRSGRFEVTRDAAFAEIIRLCAERGELSTGADLAAREPAPPPPTQAGTGRELHAMFRLGADEAEKGGSAMLALADL